jgi:hypothetical protein
VQDFNSLERTDAKKRLQISCQLSDVRRGEMRERVVRVVRAQKLEI